MNRRDFFGVCATAVAAAALPTAALAATDAGLSGISIHEYRQAVPHVYMAHSELLPDTFAWLETWRHSTDPHWARSLLVTDAETLDGGFDYASRHSFMNELYLWERPRSLKQ